MVPLLLVIYIGIELIEYKWGNKIKNSIQKAGSAGPTLGALGGSLPQCGFSVIATTLYTQRLATIGTLIAVYISTSDEAIPLILARPEKINLVIPLILTKIAIALIAGYTIDLFFRKSNQKTLTHIEKFALGKDSKSHHHEITNDKLACCHHKPSPEPTRFDLKEIFLHPVIHTAKIFTFIFAVSTLIGLIINTIGENTFNSLLSGNVILQPIVAALIGLIPNCAASVTITELYLKGSITYGATIAGLCASGGLGLLVLLREEKNKREALTIIGLLLVVSITAGLLIQALNITL